MTGSVDNIWFTRCPVPTSSGYALATHQLHRDLADLGVSLTDLATSEDAEIRRSHFNHTVPNSIRQGGNLPPLVARSRGADVRVIGFSWPTISHRVLVTQDSPIREVSDLKGRRLGLPIRKDDPADFWRPTVLRGLLQTLELAKIDPAEVEFVDIDIPGKHREKASIPSASGLARSPLSDAGFQRSEAAALIRGEVDAIFSEHASNALVRYVLGLRPIVELAPVDGERAINNGIPLVLTASGRLIDQNPELVTAWLNRVVQIPAWVRDNPDAARRLYAVESGLPEDLLAEAFPGPLENHLVLDGDERSVAALNSQNEFLAEHGFIDQPVDLSEFIDLRLLHQVLDDFGPQL